MQRHNVDRHSTLVVSLRAFFEQSTRFSHCVSAETKVQLPLWGVTAETHHTKPDLLMQDPVSGELILVDVTVTLIKNMATAAGDKRKRYSVLSDALDSASPKDLTFTGLLVPPQGCVVFPVVWSVFGDLLDDSWELLLSCVSRGSITFVSPLLLSSLKIIAKAASDVHSDSAARYRGRRPA